MVEPLARAAIAVGIDGCFSKHILIPTSHRVMEPT